MSDDKDRNLLSPKNRPQRERNLQIVRDYILGGENCSQIADRLGLSRARVNQIIHTALRHHYGATPQTPHLRLPDDIASQLRKTPSPGQRAKVGGIKARVPLIYKEWTPFDVELETDAGYWHPWPGRPPAIAPLLNSWDQARREYERRVTDREAAVRRALAADEVYKAWMKLTEHHPPPGRWTLKDYLRDLGITQSPASDAPK